MAEISDGTGSGNRAKVSGQRLFIHAIQEDEGLNATEDGDAYNLNTGDIALTSSNVSGIMYCKNNESRDLHIQAVALGVDSAGTTNNVSKVVLIRNPTSVSFSTAVDMNQNRNFGSSKTLTADVYKGAEGATVTGGNSIIQFYMASGSRLFAGIDMVLTKGDSMAVTIDTNTSSGTTTIYAALIIHLKNNDFIDD